MKYVIASPETDQILTEVELTESHCSVKHLFKPDAVARKFEQASAVHSGTSLEVSTGVSREVFLFERQGSKFTVATVLGSFNWTCSRGAAAAGGAARGGAKVLKSSMPGKVIKVFCKKGDVIEAGQPLLIIEAMKMENEIRATASGVIEEVSIQEGQKVETGETLVKLGASS